MRTVCALLLLLLFVSCSDGTEDFEQVFPEPETPVTPPSNGYDLRIAAEEDSYNIFQLSEISLSNKRPGHLNVFSSELREAYDSITWTVAGQRGRFRVFYKEDGEGYVGAKLVFKWSHTFYVPGHYETYLVCYKENRIVHSDTLCIDIADSKDFLMYDWAEVPISGGDNIGYYNALDDDYTLCSRSIMHEGKPGIMLHLSVTSGDENEFAERSDALLYDYICSIYRQPEYNRDANNLIEKYKELFSYKDENAVPHAIWLTPKNKIVLLMGNNGDWNQSWVYAEPRQ